MDRWTDGQTDKQTDRQTDRQTDKDIYVSRQKDRHRQTDRKTDKLNGLNRHLKKAFWPKRCVSCIPASAFSAVQSIKFDLKS